MVYSMNDIYPFSSSAESTTKQTIPEFDEKTRYNESTVEVDGQKQIVKKSSILTAVLILFIILFFFGFLKG
jgi:hypothetical protein